MKLLRIKAMKKSGKKKLFIIPYIFTFLNAFFGFLSIIRTLEGDFIGAALCIIIAGCMDLFDGRIARALGLTSYLGMELDSLCDVVSFCIAPTVLLYNWHVSRLGSIGLVVLAFYLCLGLYRLAKFNIGSAENKLYFIGLPTPIAAFFFADMVLRKPLLADVAWRLCLKDYYLLAVICAIALLMISPIKFPSFKYHTLAMKRTYGMITVFFVLLATCAVLHYPFFFILTSMYITGSCGRALFNFFSS